jgi:hypothetical protein
MDFRDQPSSDDAVCGACREPVAPGRVRPLASRDDLVFVEVRCDGCSSITLGFVFREQGGRLPDRIRLAGAAPVSAADVQDMRGYLEGWRGDVRSLLDGGAAAGADGRR